MRQIHTIIKTEARNIPDNTMTSFKLDPHSKKKIRPFFLLHLVHYNGAVIAVIIIIDIMNLSPFFLGIILH